MNAYLPDLIFFAGVGQLLVLVASSIVPFKMNWREDLKPLSSLHRQMYWVYGGYVVLAIISLGLISVFNAAEMAEGGGLARGLCGYVAVFWGVRLCLQAVFDVKEHLTAWCVKLGYHALTALFLFFTVVYTYAALAPTV